MYFCYVSMRCNQLYIPIMNVAGSYMLVEQMKHDYYVNKKVQSENYFTVSLVQ